MALYERPRTWVLAGLLVALLAAVTLVAPVFLCRGTFDPADWNAGFDDEAAPVLTAGERYHVYREAEATVGDEPACAQNGRRPEPLDRSTGSRQEGTTGRTGEWDNRQVYVYVGSFVATESGTVPLTCTDVGTGWLVQGDSSGLAWLVAGFLGCALLSLVALAAWVGAIYAAVVRRQVAWNSP